MRDFLSITDLDKNDISEVWKRSADFKKAPVGNSLKDKNILLLFEKPSTRTRVSFEAGINQLGGHPIYMDSSSSQLSRGESIEDTGNTLDRYVDIVVARVFRHEDLVKLALVMKRPVVNALSDLEHPCQILSDLFTIKERLGRIEGVKIAYVGDSNNVCNSLILGASIMGAAITVASPASHSPRKAIVEEAREMGGKVRVTDSASEAVRDADVVYTDAFVSMGDEKEREVRLREFVPAYQINSELMGKAPKKAIFMHCLPAHIGEEVTKDALYSDRSIVFDQAENKLHVQKALLVKLF